jgi:ribulose-phosphate 3-epimerase
VHWEAAPHLDRLLEHIRKSGAQAGVAVNPATPVEHLIDIFERLDYVLLMSVNPGFSGQAFIPRALDKARRLRALLAQANRSIDIAMDGGIDHDTIGRVVAAGVETCVVGSAIFGAANPLAAMGDLLTLARSERT